MPINEHDRPQRRQVRQTYVDQHVNMPFQQMLGMIDRRTQAFEKGLAISEATESTVDAQKGLTPDQERLRARKKYYHDTIENAVVDNEGDYGAIGLTLRNTARELKHEISTGEIGAIGGNYAKYMAKVEELQKKKDEGNLTGDEMDAILGEGMKRYSAGGGIGQDPENYNQIGFRTDVKHVDVGKKIMDAVKGFKEDGGATGEVRFVDAQGNVTATPSPGATWQMRKNKAWVSVPYQQVVDFAKTMILEDPQARESLDQEAFASLYKHGQWTGDAKVDQANILKERSRKINHFAHAAGLHQGNYKVTKDETVWDETAYGKEKAKAAAEEELSATGSMAYEQIDVNPNKYTEEDFQKYYEHGSDDIVDAIWDTRVGQLFNPSFDSSNQTAESLKASKETGDKVHKVMSKMALVDANIPVELQEEYDAAMSIVQGISMKDLKDPDMGEANKAKYDEALATVREMKKKYALSPEEYLVNGLLSNDEKVINMLEDNGIDVKAIDRSDVIDLSRTFGRARMNKAYVDSVIEQADFEAQSKGRFDWKNPDRNYKLLTDDNKSQLGIDPEKTYKMKGSNGSIISVKGSELNKMHLASRYGTEASGVLFKENGKWGEYGGYRARQLSTTEQTNKGAYIGRGVYQPDDVGNQWQIQKKVNGKWVDFITTSSAANAGAGKGFEEAKGVWALRDDVQTTKATNNTIRAARKKVFQEHANRKHVVNVHNHIGNIRTVNPITKEVGVYNTYHAQKAVDNNLTGRVINPETKKIEDISLMDVTNKMFKAIPVQFSKVGSSGNPDKDMQDVTIDKAIDMAAAAQVGLSYADIYDDNGNVKLEKEQLNEFTDARKDLLKNTKIGEPLITVKGMHRENFKPEVHIVYNLSSSDPNLSRQFSMPANRLKGSDLTRVEGMPQFVAAEMLSQFADNQPIVSPLTYKPIAVRKNGGYSVLLSPEQRARYGKDEQGNDRVPDSSISEEKLLWIMTQEVQRAMNLNKL